MLVLAEALQRLAGVNSGSAEALELYYFGGLTCREASEVLEVSEAAVERDLRFRQGMAPSGAKRRHRNFRAASRTPQKRIPHFFNHIQPNRQRRYHLRAIS